MILNDCLDSRGFQTNIHIPYCDTKARIHYFASAAYRFREKLTKNTNKPRHYEPRQPHASLRSPFQRNSTPPTANTRAGDMVEPSVAAHRKFVGTACLYRHLASRPPPFLRRNLDLALDRHAELLARSRGAAVAAPADATGGGMSANERREAGWDYPTAEMLKDLLKGQRPMLRLDALQVRHWEAVGADG